MDFLSIKNYNTTNYIISQFVWFRKVFSVFYFVKKYLVYS